MILDKTESFLLNIGGLHQRTTRKKLIKLLKHTHFCKSLNFSIYKSKQIYALELNLPKRQLPYMITYLSFHNYAIYQILDKCDNQELIDTQQLLVSTKRFVVNIDGLIDPFIKDKIIDITNYIKNTEDLRYTFNKNKLFVSCTSSTFSKLIYQIATHNIDILGAKCNPNYINNARTS